MMNLVSDNFNKMYKFMKLHKFAISCDVDNDYKCGICKNILVNAHQGLCGCNFCFECINQYMSNGALNCPNNNEECEITSLSNIVPNHIKNKQISKLNVRCFNKMCSHECQLIEMENHLNYCLNKALKCPFIDFGCEQDDMISDKLNDHMLSDIHNHNKILIDLIGNLRNEMRELKDKIEGNQLEIEMLKKNDQIKNEIIESMKEEIKLIKQENEDLTQQMQIGDRNLWYKFDEIGIEVKNKCKKDELLKEFDEKFDKEMKARYCDMKEEWNEKFDEKIKKMREENEKVDIQRSNKIDKIDKYLNVRDCGELVWQIGKINEVKLMKSELFYDKRNPYEMYLQFENINNEFNIRLYIYSGAFNDDLKWPCQADVTICISALNDFNICKKVTKLCSIEKPENNSPNCSDPIKMSHFDWSKSRLNNINCLLICIVKFK